MRASVRCCEPARGHAAPAPPGCAPLRGPAGRHGGAPPCAAARRRGPGRSVLRTRPVPRGGHALGGAAAQPGVPEAFRARGARAAARPLPLEAGRGRGRAGGGCGAGEQSPAVRSDRPARPGSGARARPLRAQPSGSAARPARCGLGHRSGAGKRGAGAGLGGGAEKWGATGRNTCVRVSCAGAGGRRAAHGRAAGRVSGLSGGSGHGAGGQARARRSAAERGAQAEPSLVDRRVDRRGRRARRVRAAAGVGPRRPRVVRGGARGSSPTWAP